MKILLEYALREGHWTMHPIEGQDLADEPLDPSAEPEYVTALVKISRRTGACSLEPQSP